MPHDPTDRIFADLERRLPADDDEPELPGPDPGLGAADPDRVADTLRAADERHAEHVRFTRDWARHGYNDAVKKQWRRNAR